MPTTELEQHEEEAASIPVASTSHKVLSEF